MTIFDVCRVLCVEMVIGIKIVLIGKSDRVRKGMRVRESKRWKNETEIGR